MVLKTYSFSLLLYSSLTHSIQVFVYGFHGEQLRDMLSEMQYDRRKKLAFRDQAEICVIKINIDHHIDQWGEVQGQD